MHMMSIPWEIIEPYLVRARLYTVPDPSRPSNPAHTPMYLIMGSYAAYGRWNLPVHPPHLSLIQHPLVTHRYRRVFLKPYNEFPSDSAAYESHVIVSSEDVSLTPNELKNTTSSRWIFYSVWEMSEPPDGWEAEGKGVGRDLVLCHGKSKRRAEGNGDEYLLAEFQA